MIYFGAIEGALGLHQRVEIVYVVDGYQASIVNEEGYSGTIAESSSRVSVYEALFELELKLRRRTNVPATQKRQD